MDNTEMVSDPATMMILEEYVAEELNGKRNKNGKINTPQIK